MITSSAYTTIVIRCEFSYSPKANSKGAAKLSNLLCGVSYTKRMMTILPNGKIPPKFHALSLEHEYAENKTLFDGRDAEKPDVAAMRWAGYIRGNMTKWRELKLYPQKLDVIKKMVS